MSECLSSSWKPENLDFSQRYYADLISTAAQFTVDQNLGQKCECQSLYKYHIKSTLKIDKSQNGLSNNLYLSRLLVLNVD